MAEAPDEELNQLKAAAPLLKTRNPKLRILVASQLSCINLDRPNLIRRLNRLVRAAGTLRARAAAARIAEVLAFAREERIAFLEETCVVTLCQLAYRRTLEGLSPQLGEPSRGLASVNGYIRGARWLAPRPLLPVFARLLSSPGLSLPTASLAIETLETWDLAQEPSALGLLAGVLDNGSLAVPQAERLGDLIAKIAAPANVTFLIDVSRRGRPPLKRAAARALRAIAGREDTPQRDLLTNALFALLDSGSLDVEVPALLGLVKQGDDYALQVLGENLRRADEGYLAALLREVDDAIPPEVLPSLVGLLGHPAAIVQERLGETLARLAAGRLGEQLRASLIGWVKGTLKPAAAEAAAPGRLGGAVVASPDLALRAKSEFRFRRENAQVLTVLFIDVVGYTERTAASDTTSLLGLIQAFEETVYPQIEAYDGRIIKKMGDGALSVFKHPLKAALAALAIQARIRAYNEFRVEREKLLVRTGLNTGLVIRKGGDVYGDVVNVAARMQASANPGEILLTHDTYGEIRDHVVCTPLGGIQVKGKKEPIMAYVATEVLGGAEGLLGSLDAGTEKQLAELNLTETIVEPSYVFPSGTVVETAMARALVGAFQDITRASEELTRDYHEENAFKRYLQEKWDELVRRINRDARGAAPL
jgi:class 3 adenylate cyclase